MEDEKGEFYDLMTRPFAMQAHTATTAAADVALPWCYVQKFEKVINSYLSFTSVELLQHHRSYRKKSYGNNYFAPEGG